MQHGSFDKKAALCPVTVCIRCSNVRNRKKKNLSPCGKRFSFYAPAGIRTLGISRKRLTASGGLKNLLRKYKEASDKWLSATERKIFRLIL